MLMLPWISSRLPETARQLTYSVFALTQHSHSSTALFSKKREKGTPCSRHCSFPVSLMYNTESRPVPSAVTLSPVFWTLLICAVSEHFNTLWISGRYSGSVISHSIGCSKASRQAVFFLKLHSFPHKNPLLSLLFAEMYFSFLRIFIQILSAILHRCANWICSWFYSFEKILKNFQKTLAKIKICVIIIITIIVTDYWAVTSRNVKRS